MTPRDSAIYKRMSAIMRFAGGYIHGGSAQSDDAPSKRALLRSSRWRPYTPRIHASNGPAFASTWESDTGDGEVFINIVSLHLSHVKTGMVSISDLDLISVITCDKYALQSKVVLDARGVIFYMRTRTIQNNS